MHGIRLLLVIVSVTRCTVSVHLDVSEHRTQPAQDDVRSRLPNRFIESLEKNNLTRPLINNHRHTGSSTHSEPAKQTNIPEHEMKERAFPDKPVLRRVLHPRPVSKHRTQPARDDVLSRIPKRFIESLERNNLTRSLLNHRNRVGFKTNINSAKQTNIIENEVDFRTSQNRPILRQVLNPRSGRYKEISNTSIVSSTLTSSGKRNMNHVNFNNGQNKNQMRVRPLSNQRYKDRRFPSRFNFHRTLQQRPLQPTWARNRHAYQDGSRDHTSEPQRYPRTDLRGDPLPHEQRMYLDLQSGGRQTDSNRWRRRQVTSHLPSSVNRNRYSMPTTRHQQPSHSTQPPRYRGREQVRYFFDERRWYNNQPVQSSRRHFERHVSHFSSDTNTRHSTETTIENTNPVPYRQQSQHFGTGRHYRDPLL